MTKKSNSKEEPDLDKMLENTSDKKNALKKIIHELDKEENKNKNHCQTKNKKS